MDQLNVWICSDCGADNANDRTKCRFCFRKKGGFKIGLLQVFLKIFL